MELETSAKGPNNRNSSDTTSVRERGWAPADEGKEST